MTPAEKDLATRRTALTRLAIAHKERLPEAQRDRDAFFRVYLDDMEKFSTDTFVQACRRLETALAFFPKKPELYEACQAVAKYKADNQKPRLALPSGDKPVDPSKWAKFRDDVRKNIEERHTMPKVRP